MLPMPPATAAVSGHLNGFRYHHLMAQDVIAYVAVSLDGFIAATGGSVKFLERFDSDEYGFEDFIEGVEAVVMGSATYEQIIDWGWPYGSTPALVLTTRELPGIEETEITFSSAATGVAIRTYAAGVEGRLWIVGGGRVITDGIRDGVIDCLELYVIPVALGSGVPLFTQAYDGPLHLLESMAFSNGVVKLAYSTSTR